MMDRWEKAGWERTRAKGYWAWTAWWMTSFALLPAMGVLVGMLLFHEHMTRPLRTIAIEVVIAALAGWIGASLVWSFKERAYFRDERPGFPVEPAPPDAAAESTDTERSHQ